MRTNREDLPPAVTKSRLKNQGDFVQMQKGNSNMVSIAWHNKRTVNLLATNADPTVMGEVQWKKKNGDVINVVCPIALKHYARHMDGGLIS